MISLTICDIACRTRRISPARACIVAAGSALPPKCAIRSERACVALLIAARGVRASDQIIYASGVEAARPQLARHRLATSFLDDQDERIDVSRMLDMAAMRAIMRRFGKLAPPAVSLQRRLDLAPPSVAISSTTVRSTGGGALLTLRMRNAIGDLFLGLYRT